MIDREKRLAEIRAREQAATKGPWEESWPEGEIAAGHRNVGEVFEECDRPFVAHARQDIPWLLEEVERLKAELESQAENFEYELKEQSIRDSMSEDD